MISNNSINECSSCHKNFNNYFNCIGCGNFFCKECTEKIFIKGKIEKSFSKCPICNLEPFITNPNIDLTKIINNKGYICTICNETIIESEYEFHILKCKYYKCILCDKKFGGKNNFFEHFSNDTLHIDLLIELMNTVKEINKEEIIKKYQNLFFDNK